MTSNANTVVKNLSDKKNILLFVLISFFAVVLVAGIGKVYAYYHNDISEGILANKVGNFDMGDGDINIVIYRENDEGGFVRVYAVPEAFYVFNDELTSCTIPCNNEDGNCEYSLDAVNKKFTLTSNQKVTCKFYFEQEMASDIDVYIYVEDENGVISGTGANSSLKYTLRENIPAYGYVYSEVYACDNMENTTVTYNSETKKINVATPTKNKCYVYFNKVGDVDIIVNAYVQDSYGTDAYTLVNYIPTNKLYTLNEIKSVCTPVVSTDTAGTIAYTDGYINIEASGKQVCDVYLDLESN